MSHKEYSEQRKIKRIKVEESARAALSSEGLIVGQIKDVSEYGLSFHYLENGKRPSGTGEISIFLYYKGFMTDRVTCNVMSDLPIFNPSPFNFIRKRRCGVQFMELTPSQKFCLKYFIDNYSKNNN